MEEKQKQMITGYVEAYNAFDVDGMLTHLHPDVHFENISADEVNLTTEGVREFAAQAEAAKAYFKKRRQTITGWSFEEDKVTINIDYFGLLAIDLPNGMKAGDTLEMQGQSTFGFSGDKIIEIVDRS